METLRVGGGERVGERERARDRAEGTGLSRLNSTGLSRLTSTGLSRLTSTYICIERVSRLTSIYMCIGRARITDLDIGILIQERKHVEARGGVIE